MKAKSNYFFLLILLFFSFIPVSCINSSFISSKNVEYVIVIHGGAGSVSKTIPNEARNRYLNSLTKALEIGQQILHNGGNAIDAVTQVVVQLENDSLFNAGRGAVINEKGEVELDASIMNGKTLSCGAVAGVKTVKNPILLARAIMNNSRHIFMIGEGAERFAKENGLEIVPNDYFKTQEMKKFWKEARENESRGTVGAVALDRYGNLASATSTGGMHNKRRGRVGDAAIIGAGTYANNKTCAISTTGWGEKFIRQVVAYQISALMEYKGYNLEKAVEEVLYNKLEPKDGGVIGVDKKGNFVALFTTASMFRGWATSKGEFVVKIWE